MLARRLYHSAPAGSSPGGGAKGIKNPPDRYESRGRGSCGVYRERKRNGQGGVIRVSAAALPLAEQLERIGTGGEIAGEGERQKAGALGGGARITERVARLGQQQRGDAFALAARRARVGEGEPPGVVALRRAQLAGRGDDPEPGARRAVRQRQLPL